MKEKDKPVVSIIAAIGGNNVIGLRNTLPWNLPADMEYFRKTTFGKPIIMGAKTFESIGKALPGRKNIVLSNNPDYEAEGCVVTGSIEEALKQAEGSEEVMVAGGASVYRQFLPLANRLYLTFIHHNFEGDSFFPEFDRNEWREVKRIDSKADESNSFDYSFVVFEKK